MTEQDGLGWRGRPQAKKKSNPWVYVGIAIFLMFLFVMIYGGYRLFQFADDVTSEATNKLRENEATYLAYIAKFDSPSRTQIPFSRTKDAYPIIRPKMVDDRLLGVPDGLVTEDILYEFNAEEVAANEQLAEVDLGWMKELQAYDYVRGLSLDKVDQKNLQIAWNTLPVDHWFGWRVAFLLRTAQVLGQSDAEQSDALDEMIHATELMLTTNDEETVEYTASALVNATVKLSHSIEQAQTVKDLYYVSKVHQMKVAHFYNNDDFQLAFLDPAQLDLVSCYGLAAGTKEVLHALESSPPNKRAKPFIEVLTRTLEMREKRCNLQVLNFFWTRREDAFEGYEVQDSFDKNPGMMFLEDSDLLNLPWEGAFIARYPIAELERHFGVLDDSH